MYCSPPSNESMYWFKVKIWSEGSEHNASNRAPYIHYLKVFFNPRGMVVLMEILLIILLCYHTISVSVRLVDGNTDENNTIRRALTVKMFAGFAHSLSFIPTIDWGLFLLATMANSFCYLVLLHKTSWLTQRTWM